MRDTNKSDNGITDKLANLTKSQSYMAVEFEKMQKDIKELQEFKQLKEIYR